MPDGAGGSGAGRVRDEIARCFALFDEGRALDAHEELETVWRDLVPGPTRTFCQGLIQAMVARVHWERARFDSARTLLARARPKLADNAPEFLGVDVAGLLARIDRWDACLAARRVPPLPSLRVLALIGRPG